MLSPVFHSSFQSLGLAGSDVLLPPKRIVRLLLVLGVDTYAYFWQKSKPGKFSSARKSRLQAVKEVILEVYFAFSVIV